MKAKSLIKSVCVSVFEHAAVCALMVLLRMLLLDENDLRSGVVIACLVFLSAAGAFWFGYGIRSGNEEKNTCWNAAMIYYIVNVLAVAALWKCSTVGAYGDLRPSGVPGLAAQLWCIPGLPLLSAVSAAQAQDITYLIVGAALGALEPMCLTLGLLSGRKEKNDKTDKETATDA